MKLAVRPDHGPLAADDGTNRPGHDAVPVQIAAAVEVAAAGDAHRQAVALRVHLRQQVRARLADVVRMPAHHRRILGVREHLLIAVRLVGRCDDDLLNGRTPPAGFEQRPGAADIRIECRDGIPVRHADRRLGGQMEDGRDFVLAERALDRLLIAHVTANHPDAFDQSGRRRAPSGEPSRAPGRRRRRRPRGDACTSQPPTSPVAPVTKTGLSRQKDGRRRCRYSQASMWIASGAMLRARRSCADGPQHRRRPRDVVASCRTGGAAAARPRRPTPGQASTARVAGSCVARLVLDEIGHVERRQALAHSAPRRRDRSAGCSSERRTRA